LGWLPLGLLQASAQQAERIEWHGKAYLLFTQPLEQRYPDPRQRPSFMVAPLTRAADNARGYIGSWRLEDDRLYLVDIQAWFCKEGASAHADCRKVTVADLFGDGATGPVFADWFNGELTLPDGAPLRQAPLEYGSSYQRTIRITLKGGKVTRIQTIDNTSGAGADHADGQRRERKDPVAASEH
jgi:hypothetical protein